MVFTPQVGHQSVANGYLEYPDVARYYREIIDTAKSPVFVTHLGLQKYYDVL